MKTWLAVSTLVLLFSACASQPAEPSSLPPFPEQSPAPTLEFLPAASPEAGSPEATPVAEANCATPEVNDLAADLAADYDFATQEQIIEWFCSGAEFEDILLALETQALAGLPAEDALSMLAGGMTWEEIWQEYGLTE